MAAFLTSPPAGGVLVHVRWRLRPVGPRVKCAVKLVLAHGLELRVGRQAWRERLHLEHLGDEVQRGARAELRHLID